MSSSMDWKGKRTFTHDPKRPVTLFNPHGGLRISKAGLFARGFWFLLITTFVHFGWEADTWLWRLVFFGLATFFIAVSLKALNGGVWLFNDHLNDKFEYLNEELQLLSDRLDSLESGDMESES